MTTLEEKVALCEEIVSNPPWDEVFYTHWTKRLTYSFGMQALAEAAGCHWLIDLIASHQINPKVRREEFQIWTLRKTESPRAVAECRRDKDAPLLARQCIPHTDFPLDEIKLYVENGMLLLPSER